MTHRVFTVPLISTDGMGASPAAGPAAPSYRHFIVGPENALLRCLVEAVGPEVREFPLITLTGPSGVGKSHLLHGLVERFRVQSNGDDIVFATGADFARAYARAVEVDSVADWRERQRSCRLFVMDDVHELATKQAAQQELVNTLDALTETDAQVLLAIRPGSMDWSWMISPLRSRMEGGLVIPIVTPSTVTSEYIVRKVYEEFATPPNAMMLPSLGHRPLTYPQLRAFVIRRLQGKKLGIEPTKPVASQFLPRITKAVAKHYQVKVNDLLGPSRRQFVVSARGVAIYLARTLLKISFDEIGEHFGGRDHTTILHAWRKTGELVETDAVLRHDVEKLSRSLAANFEIHSVELGTT